MEARENPRRQADQAAVVEVQSMQTAQAHEGVRGHGLQVLVVTQVQLLQPVEAMEGGRLNVGNVVGVEPQHGGGGGEMAAEQPLDLVVLQEDALALGRDALRHGVEVVSLAGDGAGRCVTDAVARTGQREVQAAQHQEQLHPAITWGDGGRGGGV